MKKILTQKKEKHFLAPKWGVDLYTGKYDILNALFNGCCFQAKQHLKAEQLEAELAEGKKSEVADEPDSEDEDKYADRIDMPGQKFDTKRWVVCLLLIIYASLSQALTWLGQAKLQQVGYLVEGSLCAGVPPV